MIFAFAEDGMVMVLDDLAAAQRECEGIDVESGVYVFYAEDGSWLRPRLTTPNRQGGFAIFKWVESGVFVLEPESSLPAHVDPFDVALSEAVDVVPNGVFATLEAVRGHVAAKRGTSPGP